MQTATLKRIEPATPVKVTSLGYEMTARREKAEKIARVLHAAGFSPAEAEQLTVAQWRVFAGSLKAKGVLAEYSTPLSAETIERTIVELRKLASAAAVRRILEAA
jgi:hypothetical protein